MDEPEESLPRITETFHSFYEDGPFRTCVDCDVPLPEVANYMIQKVIKKGEVIFEFALCDICQNRLSQDFSEETRERLDSYVADRIHEINSVKQCAMCLKDRSELEEYAVAGTCLDEFLLYQMCICLECRSGMEHLISEKTRRTWNDFVGKNFPGVPDFVDRPMLI